MTRSPGNFLYVVLPLTLMFGSELRAQAMVPASLADRPSRVTAEAVERAASKEVERLDARGTRTISASDWQRAAHYALENPNGFAAALRQRIEDPERADAARARGEAGAMAVSLALQASTSAGRVAATAHATPEAVPSIHTALLTLHRELVDAQQSLVSGSILVYADAALRTAAESETDRRTGTGSVGVIVQQSERLRITALVVVASTQDTLFDGLGGAILSPMTGRTLASGLLDIRVAGWPKFLPNDIDGTHVYLTTSRQVWARSDRTAAGSVVVTGVGALLFKDLASGRVGANYVGLQVEAGIGTRWLTGDLSRANAVRDSILGTGNRFFIGPEMGLQITFGKLTAALQYYYLFDGSDGGEAQRGVDGLSGGQLVGGISLAGELLTGTLDRIMR